MIRCAAGLYDVVQVTMLVMGSGVAAAWHASEGEEEFDTVSAGLAGGGSGPNSGGATPGGCALQRSSTGARVQMASCGCGQTPHKTTRG